MEETVAKYRSAIEKFRSARSEHLALYPGVLECLQKLKASGKTLAVFTESQTFYTVMRFKKLGLEGLVQYLFTSEDHETPEASYLQAVRAHPPEHYQIKETIQRSVGKGRLKPDPEILNRIVTEVGASKSNTVYVGDSLYKDVIMAKDAAIFGAWAEYGEARDQPGYELLREVSHWTDDDVQKDRDLKKRDVDADAVLKDSFAEIIDYL
ncbi:MAG: HAD family hydrolase [Pseudolabrys sp.]